MPNSWLEKEVEELISVIAKATDERQVEDLLDRILTPREINDMARRLRVASMLEDGRSYFEISEKLKMSPNTISKISHKIGYGFRRSSVKNKISVTGTKRRRRVIRYKKAPTITEIITGHK